MPPDFDWHWGWAATVEEFFEAKCASPSAAHALTARRPPKWMLARMLELKNDMPGWVRRDELFELGRLWAAHQLRCEQPGRPESIAAVAAHCGLRESAATRLWSTNRETVLRQVHDTLVAARKADRPVCMARLATELRAMRRTESQGSDTSPAGRVRDRWQRDWVQLAELEAER